MRKKKTQQEQFESLLQQKSKQELIDFLLAYAEQSPYFRQDFLLEMQDDEEAESKQFFDNVLHGKIDEVARNGFISYRDAYELVDVFDDAYDLAEKNRQKGKLASASNLAFAMIDKAFYALPFTDDSNGVIGDAITQAFHTLRAIAAEPLDEKLRLSLYRTARERYLQKTFQGWDWHSEMFDLAMSLMKHEGEKEELRLALEKEIAAEKRSWQLSSYKHSMHHFLEKIRGKEAAHAYMRDNLDVTDFRKQVIEESLSAHELELAAILIDEALQKEEGSKIIWLDLKLHLEMQRQHVESIITTAKDLFLRAHDHERYYQILKTHTDPAQWSHVVDELLSAQEATRGHASRALLCWEHRWGQYIEWLHKHVGYHSLATAIEDLPASEHLHLPAIYEQHILNTLSQRHRASRSDYQEATRAMKRMIDIGTKDQVTQLIAKLRELYRRRPALLDELSKLETEMRL